MKKLAVFVLVLCFIFSGCSEAEIPDSEGHEISSESESSSSSSFVPESSSSGNIPQYSPSSNCVPDRSVSSRISEPSHLHSTDTSVGENYSENTHYVKGRVVKSLPRYSDSPNAALGREEILKRWYFAIADISGISEIRLQSAIADERELHFEETSAIIESLRSLSPGIKPQMDNPSTGGSFTVAAFDSYENELWRVTLDGYWFVLSFGGENASYVFDMSGQNYDTIIAAGNYVSSSLP
ncbi:MAG: hypothetical protein IJ945_08290 [Oscillospiraceae bacterium]|nr:hypothetical protein [Oscillospiraceae bacterium]